MLCASSTSLYMVDFSSPSISTSCIRKAIPQMVGMIMEGLYGKYDPAKEYPAHTVIPSANIRKATMKDAINLFERAFNEWEL